MEKIHSDPIYKESSNLQGTKFIGIESEENKYNLHY